MEKVKCTIERITFQNPENGYAVLQATIKGYREEQTLVGTFHEVTVGAVLTVEGNWRVDKRYGRQFAVEKWTEELPADIIGIEKYLGSGLVKGIGPKYAKLIVAKFGLETFDVIENDADKLLEVYGIGKGRVEKIRASWEKQKDVKDIMVFLQGHGVRRKITPIPILLPVMVIEICIMPNAINGIFIMSNVSLDDLPIGCHSYIGTLRKNTKPLLLCFLYPLTDQHREVPCC